MKKDKQGYIDKEDFTQYVKDYFDKKKQLQSLIDEIVEQLKFLDEDYINFMKDANMYKRIDE